VDDVQLFAESEGCGDMVTMRASANTADDGTGNGEWIFFYELGLPHIEPMWLTRSFSDGTHLVRVEARGCGNDWEHSAVREEPYTLLHRRPAQPNLVAPLDGQVVGQRTVTFRWEEAIRADTYQLQVSTNPDPGHDPLLDIALPADVISYTSTFTADHPVLYWRVAASNDIGTSYSAQIWQFGIDRTDPDTSVTPLPAVSFEPYVSVSWGGTDAPAGIQQYDVQFRDGDRGAWVDWLVGVKSTVALFRGQAGHVYYFRSRGLDHAQNQEPYPAVADTYTLIDPSQLPPSPWWDAAYSAKRDVTVLNNDAQTMWAGYPINLHFDDTTSPTAAALYAASQPGVPGDDFRIVHSNATELARYVQQFTPSVVDIWFNTQVDIAGLGTDSESYQLYYGNADAASPPGDINEVFEPGTDANTVGLWHFQEGAGSAIYDSSGRGHTGTLHNGVWLMSGLGRAVDLNGDNTYIDVPSHTDFNVQNITLEAWIWVPEYVGTNKIIFRPVDPPDAAAAFGIETSNQKIRLEGCSAPLENDHAIPTGEWVHVAGTYDGSTLRVYINGNLDGERPCPDGLQLSDQPVGIGFNPNDGGIQHFYGRMQHVRISDVARTSFPYAAQRPLDAAASTVAGEQLQQPNGGNANLLVQSLSSYPSSVGGIIVQAVVRNEGDAPTMNGFYTDLYADHEPDGPGDLAGSIRFWITSPIEAGATVTLTTVLHDVTRLAGLSAVPLSPLGETSVTLYSQADSEGVVAEPDDLDNISSGLDVCIAAADAYEGDDTFVTATPLPAGQLQPHNFHAPADPDWFRIEVQEGLVYTLRTTQLGPSSDTYLYLYDGDGTTLLAANDDADGSLASRLEWMAPADGTYYLLVKHWNPAVAGCGTRYSLYLNDVRIFVPLVHKE
jgi:hypothetical protein